MPFEDLLDQAPREGEEVEAAEHSFDDLAKGMASGTLTRSRALKLTGAAILGSALSIFAIPDEAEARHRKKKKKRRSVTSPVGLSPYVQLLISREHLWYEPPNPADGIFGICHLYDFQVYYGQYGVAARHSYPLNPLSGNCDTGRAFEPTFGMVWTVRENLLTITRTTGGSESITLGTYNSSTDSLPIFRSTTGNSVWHGCRALGIC
jgi:hypothetical protein